MRPPGRRGGSSAPDWLTGAFVERLSGQLEHAPRPVLAGTPQVRPAAVLLLVGPSADGAGTTPAGATILLTRRTSSLRSHPGQVSFPGGGREPEDVRPSATALREAAEEVGLAAAEVQVIAELPELAVRPRNQSVTPVLAWWRSPGRLVPDPAEVDVVVSVSLGELADPANRVAVRHPSGGTWPAFRLQDDVVVWGFTALVLDAVVVASGLERPWDDGRVIPFPASEVVGPVAPTG